MAKMKMHQSASQHIDFVCSDGSRSKTTFKDVQTMLCGVRGNGLGHVAADAGAAIARRSSTSLHAVSFESGNRSNCSVFVLVHSLVACFWFAECLIVA